MNRQNLLTKAVHMEYNHIHNRQTQKRISTYASLYRERTGPERPDEGRDMWLKGPYQERMEPALESHTRRTGVTAPDVAITQNGCDSPDANGLKKGATESPMHRPRKCDVSRR